MLSIIEGSERRRQERETEHLDTLEGLGRPTGVIAQGDATAPSFALASLHFSGAEQVAYLGEREPQLPGPADEGKAPLVGLGPPAGIERITSAARQFATSGHKTPQEG